MDIEDVIKGRRTVHIYETTPVDKEIVKKALELGLYAPNHKLTFPWRFIELSVETREKVAQVTAKLKSQKMGKEPSENFIKSVVDKFLTPPILIALVYKLHDDSLTCKEDYASVACAVQNISLFLWSHGIGTKWGSGSATRDASTYEILKLNPDTDEIAGFLWGGIPKTIPSPQKRPSLEDVFIEI